MQDRIEGWEFSVVRDIQRMFKSKKDGPSEFNETKCFEVLNGKLSLAKATLSKVQESNPTVDPLVLSSKVAVNVILKDYIVLVELSMLGVGRAVRVINQDRFIDSLNFPDFSIGGNQ